jgi:SAM-dependent methyltransferase
MLKKLLSDLAVRGMVGLGLVKAPVACPVCNGKAKAIGTVDFNRSCEDSEGRVFEPSGKLVEYCLCERCGYCFAPEFLEWPEQRFLDEIYNNDYILVDPELSELRPDRVALEVEPIFGGAKGIIEHLDYGGGLGALSRRLAANGWKSASFDPFFPEPAQSKEGLYDLVTAIEVFEHVPNPRQLVEDLIARLRPDGILFFSTLLSDGVQQEASLLDWWYLAPRNGHVSLFSTASLRILFGHYEFKLLDVRPGVHLAYRRLPQWCQGLDAFAALKK